MSNGDLASLGGVLRAAREERALTLEEVETETRIRVKFLEALENGDLSVLPSVAHARGFLRNYAQYLGLDANAMATQFSILTGTGRLSAAQAAPPSYAQPEANQPPTVSSFDSGDQPASPPSMPTPYPLPPGPSAATGTGPLRTRSTYVPPAQRVGPGMPAGVPAQPVPRTGTTPAYGLAVPAMQPQVVQPERPSTPLHRLLQSNLIIGGVLLVGMIAIVWWAVSSLSSISSSQFAATPDSPTLLAGSNGSAEPASLAPLGTPSPSAPFAGGPNSLDRVLLNITVTQRTWARIVVDGAVAFEGQLVPGSVVQYQGVTSVVVRAGNAAGLSVNYNGQDLGPLGAEGEVVERTFTTSGQITPTPTLTPNPTNTSVPTPTPRTSPTPTPNP